MKIEGVPFSKVAWAQVSPTEHLGQSGTATWRTLETGNVRVRMVDYSPGYVADHWCPRGHVVLVLTGELRTELKDGRTFVLNAGDSYQVGNDGEPHRSSSATGCRLFIVD
jgi:hypothetical protein